MATVIINKFDGGHSEDIRTFDTDKCQQNLNFNTYKNPHKLIPIRDNVEGTLTDETVTMSQVQISDVSVNALTGIEGLIAQGYDITGSGTVSSSPAFFKASSMNGSWTYNASASHTKTDGTMVTYVKKPYILSQGSGGSSGNYYLQELTSGGTVNIRGTVTPSAVTSGYSYPVPKPVVHPSDTKLYYGVGDKIRVWDGSSDSASSLVISNGLCLTSFTYYGEYVAFAVKPLSVIGNSYAVLWDKNLTSTTVNNVIDFGVGDLQILENISGSLVGIVSPSMFASSTIDYKVDIKLYEGGAVRTIKSIPLTSTSSGYSILKAKTSDKLYFVIGGDTTAIWAVYKNKEGNWVCTQERYLYDGSTTGAGLIDTIVSISIVGDYFFMGFIDGNGTYRLRTTSISADYTFTSKYITTINPNMPNGDRYKDKELKAIQIAYTGNNATNSIALKYAVDTTTMTSVISSSNVTGEGFIEATAEDGGAVFKTGKEFQFQVESTGGVEIKEIRYRYETTNSQV